MNPDHSLAWFIALGTGAGAALGSAVGLQVQSSWRSLAAGGLFGAAAGAAVGWYKLLTTTTGGV